MTNHCAKFFAALVAVLLLATSLPVQAVTADLELVGEAAGLVLIPPKGKLFDLKNMSPGDTRTATITIRNSHTTRYDLWMQAEERATVNPGLLEIMEFTAAYRGKVLYRGPADGLVSGMIHLGRFRPGESGELEMTVHLPGPETDNRYQGKSAGVRWIFTARAGDDPVVEPVKRGDLPRTGGAGPTCLCLLPGGLILTAGIFTVRKRKGAAG